MEYKKLLIMLLFSVTLLIINVNNVNAEIYQDTIFSGSSCGEFNTDTLNDNIDKSHFYCDYSTEDGLELDLVNSYVRDGEFFINISDSVYDSGDYTYSLWFKITDNSEYYGEFDLYSLYTSGTEDYGDCSVDDYIYGNFLADAERDNYNLTDKYRHLTNQYGNCEGEIEYDNTGIDYSDCINDYCLYQLQIPSNSRNADVYINREKKGNLAVANSIKFDYLYGIKIESIGAIPNKFNFKRFKFETGNKTDDYTLEDVDKIQTGYNESEVYLSDDFDQYTNTDNCNNHPNLDFSSSNTSLCDIENGIVKINNASYGEHLDFIPDRVYKGEEEISIKIKFKTFNASAFYGEDSAQDLMNLGRFAIINSSKGIINFNMSGENYQDLSNEDIGVESLTGNEDWHVLTINYNPFDSYTTYFMDNNLFYRQKEDYNDFGEVFSDKFVLDSFKDVEGNEYNLNIWIDYIQMVEGDDSSIHYRDVTSDYESKNFTPSSTCFGSSQCQFYDNFDITGTSKLRDYSDDYNVYYTDYLTIYDKILYFNVSNRDKVPFYTFDISDYYSDFYYSSSSKNAENILFKINPDYEDAIDNLPVVYKFNAESYSNKIGSSGLKIEWVNDSFYFSTLNFDYDSNSYDVEADFSLTKEELSKMDNKFLIERIYDYNDDSFLFGVKGIDNSYYNGDFIKDVDNQKATHWEYYRLDYNDNNNATLITGFDAYGFYILGDTSETDDYITDIEKNLNKSAPYGESEEQLMDKSIKEQSHGIASMFGFTGYIGRIMFGLLTMIAVGFSVLRTNKIDAKSKFYSLIIIEFLLVFLGWYMEFLPTKIMIVVLFIFAIIGGIFLKNTLTNPYTH